MKTIYNNVLRLLLVALMAMPLLATAQVTLRGTGTADDPYEIGTADELEAFANIVNADNAGTKKCAILKKDIDYTAKTTTIGIAGTANSNRSFAGTFDGDGHTIKIKFGTETSPITENYIALFQYVGGTKTIGNNIATTPIIKNLTVEGEIFTSGDYAGGVVGRATNGYSTSTIEISNVTSNVKITTSGAGKRAGGVVGYVYCKASNVAQGTVKLSNVTSNAEITTLGQHAGGIVGFTDYAKLTIEKSSSHAKITYNGTAAESYCGGIIGLVFEYTSNHNESYGSSHGTVKIECCAFAGSFVNGSSNGGLIGESRSDRSEYYSIIVEIRNSYSYCKPVKGCHYGVFCGKCIEYTSSSGSGGKLCWYVTNKVYNSYYLMPDDLNDLGDIQIQGQGRSASQFKDGTICRLLNELNSSNTTWRQNFSGNVDPLPVTDETHAEISWPSLEGYNYEEIFCELNISGSFNRNGVKGSSDDASDFEDGIYLHSEATLPEEAASAGRKYLPISFDKNTYTIKNYWSVPTPFKLGWNGEQSDFVGNDCLRFDSDNTEQLGLDGTKEIVLTGTGNKFKELYMCATCGGKNANTPALVKVEIEYKDNSTQTTAFFVDDWILTAPNGYTATRQYKTTTTIEDGNVYCYPLNDALDPEKEISKIKVTNMPYENSNNPTVSPSTYLKAGIFAITGLRLSEPKHPEEVTANINSDGTKMTLTWTKVTELVIDGVTPPENSISYVYDVATDKEFKHIVPGMESIPVVGTLSRGTYTAEIAGDFRNKFVRVRATNIIGQSLGTSAMVMPVVLYDDKSESDMQTKISDWKELGDNSETVDVKVMRSFTNTGEYYTLCLPFDVSDEQIANELQGCSVYKYKQARINNGVLDIEFVSATEIEAGVPYFIKWNGSVNVENPVFENVTVTREEPSQIVKEYATCKGTFVPTHLSSESGENENYLFLVGNNTLLWPEVGDPSDLKGLRAYFQITDSKVRYGMPTSIVDNPDADIEIEEIEVRKLYQNGRVVIIKDGVKYDLFGRVIE